MNPTLNAQAPTVSRTFSAPEIWVILQALGAVKPGLAIPPEIASDPAAVTAAQKTLLKQGAVLANTAGKLRPARDVDALVRPATYPDQVFMLNINGPEKMGIPPQVVCFGRTRESLVVNWVDEKNIHHFKSYKPSELKGCIWEHLMSRCILDVDTPNPEQANLTQADVEKAMAEMKQSVLIMAVTGIQSAKQTTRALGWFVSGQSAWLMERDEQNHELAPSLASQVDIQDSLFALIEASLPADKP